MYPQVAGGFSCRLVVFGVRPVEIFEDKQIKRSTIETGRSEGGLSGLVDGQQKKVTRIWSNSTGEIE